jgi:hypothetical protein
LRRADVADLLSFARKHRPRVLELSKDFLTDEVSLKDLARQIDEVKETAGVSVSFAGTTDLVRCAGFSWDRYRQYLQIQTSQARFLGSAWFRALLGPATEGLPRATVMSRLCEFAEDVSPMRLCVEIHGGIESDPEVLPHVLKAAPVDIVVDLENMHRAGLDGESLRAVLPPDRIAYFHVRNLSPVWIEHPPTEGEVHEWQSFCPDGIFLWEPKTTDDPRRAMDVFDEYRTFDRIA